MNKNNRLLETALPESNASGTQLLADPTLAAFAQLGASRLNTARAFISLIDRDTQYVLAEATPSTSSKGHQFDASTEDLWFGCTARPASETLCSWTLATWNLGPSHAKHGESTKDEVAGAVFVVNDLSKDDRFAKLPFVEGPPFVRFYAGAPLISSDSNQALGSFCVIDVEPRDGLDHSAVAFLVDMANTCMTHLHLKRAHAEKARSEKMVRGIGAFVEGESSIQEWWSRTRPDMGRHVVGARMQAGYSSVYRPKSSSQAQAGQSDISTPKNGLNEMADRSTPVVSRPSVDSVQQQDSLDPNTLLSRACNIIREATEVEGVVFLDARTTSLRDPKVKDGDREHHSASSDSELSATIDPGRTCQILGVSTDERAEHDVDDFNPATSLRPCAESFLRKLLRQYPKGHIWHIDELSSGDESEGRSLSSHGGHESPDEGSMTSSVARKKKGRVTSSSLLSRTFPGARCIAFFPLWDAYKERYFAGAFAYTLSPFRDLTIEDDLSYLAAFGNTIMSEILREDTLKSDRAKTDFISSISHELRSPLHGILGSSEMLRESVLELRQSDLLQNIETCGRSK